VVGMPAAVASFVTVQDYRLFFIRTRRELRARGFAVATIFFHQGDIKTGRLISRIKKYNIDTLLWYQPKQGAKEITAHLKHAGVGIVGISDSGLAGIRCRYEVQRELAIRQILRDWLSRHEIKSVIVIRTTKPLGAMEETLQTLLEEQGLAFEFKTVGDHRLKDFLEVLSRNKRAGIIFSSLAASFFAFRVPDGLTKLMSQSPVALTGGPMSLAFAQVPEVHVDLVVVDWQLVAEQIVTDLISKKAFDSDKVSVFDAQAHLRAPLSHYAESL